MEANANPNANADANANANADADANANPKERESNLIKKENKTRCTPSAVKLKAKEDVPLDLKSTSDKKQSSISSGVKLKGKIEDTKPNTKKIKDDDRKSESESNIVKESNANANPNAEEKGLVDPLAAEEASSILDPKRTSEEKSSLSRESNLIKKETKRRSTPSTVKHKEEVQRVETKPKEDNHDELRTRGISKGTDESLSQAKEKVPLDLKSTSYEKSSSVACNRNKGEDVPSSKVNTSSISSSKGKLKEKNKHMKTERDPIPRHEKGSPKLIYKGSIRRAQKAPEAADQFCLPELKGLVFVTEHQIEEPPTKESQTEEPPAEESQTEKPPSEESQTEESEEPPTVESQTEEPPTVESQTEEPLTNPEGGVVNTIYKEEAICKKCCEPLFDESNVLRDENVERAKCKCKLALIHANCAKKWEEEKGTKCLACEEQIKYIPVTLAIATSPTSSPQMTNNENLESPTYAPKR